MSYDGGFAGSYDRLTKNVNYRAYADRIDTLIKRYRPGSRCIVELGCGTMSLGIKLYELGYAVSGVDLSDSMLKRAGEKIARRGINIEIFRQDMRMLKLPRPADVFVCSLDGLNHLASLEDVRKTFNSVRHALSPDGLFIFDMNTPYKHRSILGDNTFVYELPGIYCVWQNEFSEADCSVGITIDIFKKNDNGYERSTEKFRERAYPEKDILNALEASGLSPVAQFDELKSSRPTSRTERILYVARRA